MFFYDKIQKEKQKRGYIKVKCILFCILLCLFPITITYTYDTYAEEEIKETQLYAKAAVLMDAQSGRVLYAKNEIGRAHV